MERLKNIDQVVQERKEFATKHGYIIDQLNRMLFVVTDKKESKIFEFNNVDISSKLKTLKKNNITAAVIYDGHLVGISTTFQANNDEEHQFFDQYKTDATKGITAENCIELIIEDCNNVVTVL